MTVDLELTDLEALEVQRAEVEERLSQLESDFRYLPSAEWPSFAQDQRRELRERLALAEETLSNGWAELNEAKRELEAEERRRAERERKAQAKAERELPKLAATYLKSRCELHTELQQARRLMLEAATVYFEAKRKALSACEKLEENVATCEPGFQYPDPRYPRPVERLLEHTLTGLGVPETTALTLDEERLLKALIEDLLAGPMSKGPGEVPWPRDLRGPLPK